MNEINHDFTPLFKERSKDSLQFVWAGTYWRKANEYQVSSLWSVWVSSDNADRYWDDQGFLVYGFKK